jgi:CheY-like chemotaxis protein
MIRVLIVDDDPASRELLVEFVTGQGHRALTASGGSEALCLVKAERPHVVLLDHLMPRMSGLETLLAIRQIDAEVAIVMVTGLGEEALGQRALGLGAYEFVTKPVDLKHLDRILTHATARMLF